jgi:hypothetical protein
MLRWFRGRRQAERLAKADAAALIRDHGGGAYSGARRRERDVILPDGQPTPGAHPRVGGAWRSSRRT